MEHSEFLEGIAAGKIDLVVDKNAAGFLYGQPGLLPEPLRRRQANVRALGIGLLILGIALFFFVPWYVGAACVLAGLVQFPRAQKLAAADVADAVMKSPMVFQHALSRNVIQLINK